MMKIIVTVSAIDMVAGVDLFDGIDCSSGFGVTRVMLDSGTDNVADTCCTINHLAGNSITCSPNDVPGVGGGTCYRNRRLKVVREQCVQAEVDAMYDFTTNNGTWNETGTSWKNGLTYKEVNPNDPNTCCNTVLNCDNLANDGSGCTGVASRYNVFCDGFLVPFFGTCIGDIVDDTGASVTGTTHTLTYQRTPNENTKTITVTV